MLSLINGEPRVNDDMKILSVVGARPNFMKIAPIMSAIERHNKRSHKRANRIHHILVHTGQHYDDIMSGVFFEELRIQKPDICLGVGSASHAVQTAEIMSRFEKILMEYEPDVVIVVGDVNSTVACALVASKFTYPKNMSRPLVAHVEAGLRSFDRSMPEEVNRIVTDHLSDYLFVSEESGLRNLLHEGVPASKIFFVGNTMIDTLLMFESEAKKSKIMEKLGLRNALLPRRKAKTEPSARPYALVTLHRPSNVDDKNDFSNIIKALKLISGAVPVLLPCHPRTRNKIIEFGLESHFTYLDKPDVIRHNVVSDGGKRRMGERIYLLNPLGYLDFLCLMSNASVVLTDSGGIQEETTCLGVPCITIRENTERPVTVTAGTNVLAGTDRKRILEAFHSSLKRRKAWEVPDKWDGHAASRIIRTLVKHYRSL
jgi:UDP-N-acetylglucosamine 2-epimerase (non-hydrolysing)